MTEELITELSGIKALQVISPYSSMRYKKSDKPLPEIARELGVDGIVTGSVLRSGGRVRVTAQLTDVPNGTNLWAQTYDRDFGDTLALQREIVGRITEEIQITTSPEEKGRLSARQPISAKALEFYYQGVYHFNRFGRGFGVGDQEAKTAISYFQQAVAEDPNFAEAYAKMGRQYEGLMQLQDQAIPQERAAAEKALELDPNLADAHILLGSVKLYYEWDLAGAEREFKRAIELDPNSAEAHDWFAFTLN